MAYGTLTLSSLAFRTTATAATVTVAGKVIIVVFGLILPASVGPNVGTTFGLIQTVTMPLHFDSTVLLGSGDCVADPGGWHAAHNLQVSYQSGSWHCLCRHGVG